MISQKHESAPFELVLQLKDGQGNFRPESKTFEKAVDMDEWYHRMKPARKKKKKKVEPEKKLRYKKRVKKDTITNPNVDVKERVFGRMLAGTKEVTEE